MAKSIKALVDELPTTGMTVSLLNALDLIVPGEWQNPGGFDNLVRSVSGETNEGVLRRTSDRAVALYDDAANPYQRAVRIYQAAGLGSTALGGAALASKLGEDISFLSVLSRITPKADTTQVIDLGMKLAAEALAFFQLNALPVTSLSDFTAALTHFKNESLIRMAALVAVDALVPLGPDFVQKVGGTLSKVPTTEVQNNSAFNVVSNYLPGTSPDDKLSFVTRSFTAAQAWMNDFITQRGLTVEGVVGQLKTFVNVTDDKLDYLGAFTDLTMNYFSHTGTLTVARAVIERAATEVKAEVANEAQQAAAQPIAGLAENRQEDDEKDGENRHRHDDDKEERKRDKEARKQEREEEREREKAAREEEKERDKRAREAERERDKSERERERDRDKRRRED